jgi:hypothetical protein
LKELAYLVRKPSICSFSILMCGYQWGNAHINVVSNT